MAHNELREALDKYFSLGELRMLCFDLHIDYENLEGDSKNAKIISLILFCQRRHRLPELLNEIQKLRPGISFEQLDLHSPQTRPETARNVAVPAPAVVRPTNLSFDTTTALDSPSGWFDGTGFITGVSREYEIRVLPRSDAAGSCVMLRSLLTVSEADFGSLMQRCLARQLAGTGVRVQGEIRTWQVEQGAGIWVRVDGERVSNLVFDNMASRPIKGTSAWGVYSIEIQMPADAVWLNYGILLRGTGTVWADNFRVMTWTSSAGWDDM